MPAYEISTDSARLDVDAIHAFLTRSYWSPGVMMEVNKPDIYSAG